MREFRLSSYCNFKSILVVGGSGFRFESFLLRNPRNLRVNYKYHQTLNDSKYHQFLSGSKYHQTLNDSKLTSFCDL